MDECVAWKEGVSAGKRVMVGAGKHDRRGIRGVDVMPTRPFSIPDGATCVLDPPSARSTPN